MEHVVLVIHLILAVALVIVVLLQRSEGAGLVGPSASTMMPVRGSANILTRATAVLAGLFMMTSLILAAISGKHGDTRSLAETIADEQQQPAQGDILLPPPSGAPETPALPQETPQPPPLEAAPPPPAENAPSAPPVSQ